MWKAQKYADTVSYLGRAIRSGVLDDKDRWTARRDRGETPYYLGQIPDAMAERLEADAAENPAWAPVGKGQRAQILTDQGQALRPHRERLKVYEALGNGHERAITLGDIARILNKKGPAPGGPSTSPRTTQSLGVNGCTP